MGLNWRAGDETADGRWVIADLDRDWVQKCRVAIRGGQLVIAELQVVAKSGTVPADGLGWRQSRGVGIQGAVAMARASGLRPSLFREAAEPATARSYALTRKRQHRDARLAAIALAYDQALRDGRRDTTRALVRATGLPVANIRELVHQCRRHEPPLLTGGGRGRSGGEVTEEARQIAAGWWVAFGRSATATATAHGATVRTTSRTT